MLGQYDNIVQNFDYHIADERVNATATTTGDEVQLAGGPILVMVYLDTVTTADATHYFTFSVTQSTATGGTFAAADSSQYLVADSWDLIINATTEVGLKVFQFIPVAGYDFIKVVATETGTGDITYSAFVIQGGIHQPETT